MDRSRTWWVVVVIVAVVLAGIGHNFVAFQRDAYPIDGYVFYTASALLFAWVWRSTRGLPEADLRLLREPLGRLVGALRDTAATFRAIRFGPTLVLGIAILNVISAVLALLIGSAIVYAGWGASIVWLAVAVWPRGRARESTAGVPASQVVVEDEPSLFAATPRLRLPLAVAGLLAAALGQMVIAAEEMPPLLGALSGPFSEIAAALRLHTLLGAVPALAGLTLLVAGALMFGAATRGVALADRPRLAVEQRAGQGASLGNRWWIAVVAGLGLWLLVVQSANTEMIGWGPPLMWLAALALIGAVWRRVDVDRGVRLGVSIERMELYGLLAVSAAALIVWLLQLDRLPASIWGDEGAYWTLARDLSKGAEVSLFGFGTYGFPIAGSIFQSLWVILFGPTIGAWRLGSVLAGLASLPPLYFVARSLLGRRVAFASLALFAASPFALAYGRTGYLYPQSILPVTLSAALTVAAICRDSRLFAYLAGLVSGATFMLYPSARFAVVLCVLISIAFARWMRASAWLRLGLAYASAVVLAAMPTVVYGLTHDPATVVDKLVENSMANVSFAESIVGRDELLAQASFTATRDHQLFVEPSLYAALAVRGWVITFISLNRPGLASEHYVVGPLAAPGAWLFVLGVGWSLARLRRPGYAVWLIWLFAGTFLLGAIASYPPHASDVLPVTPALAVIAAMGLVGLLDSVMAIGGRVGLNAPTWIGHGLLVAVVAVVSFIGLRAYFVEMPTRYKPNLEMAMFWSALDLSPGSAIVFVRDAAYPPDFVPWGLQNFDTGVAWLPVEPADLTTPYVQAACEVDCAVFGTPGHAPLIDGVARATFGEGGWSRVYTNESGEPIGFAAGP